jgi:proton glutamate symport protein
MRSTNCSGSGTGTDVEMARAGAFLKVLTGWLHQPVTVLASVVIALVLGASGWPLVESLRPIGELYVALLQMCVLPFLLAAIPLAVRSAMTGATNAQVIRSLVGWIACAIIGVVIIGVLVPAIVFHFLPFDRSTITAMGALVGGSVGKVDFEFSIDHRSASSIVAAPGTGLVALVPSNIFSALSADDTMRVLVFATIFGISMAASERRSGRSLFDVLQNVHDTCLLIFHWLNLFVPIGIIALIAPQMAQLGPSVYVVLAHFSYVFFSLSAVILIVSLFTLAIALRVTVQLTFARFSRPLMVAAATRNTLACIPVAVETMTRELQASQDTCELYIPIGFATLRFGTMLHFAVATMFIGALLGRTFSPADMVMVAILSAAGSFATLGISGAAALAPLAGVLRPFGLPYELAFPLLVIIDPLVHMVRIMLNVTVNCLIPALASGSRPPKAVQSIPAK